MTSKPSEADICRKYVVPKLQAAGWDDEPHSIAEQRTFTDGRIVITGNKAIRRPRKRADYLLRYTPDFMIAVVEAKADHASPADGLQQAKQCAEILGLKFAYSTNGNQRAPGRPSAREAASTGRGAVRSLTGAATFSAEPR